MVHPFCVDGGIRESGRRLLRSLGRGSTRSARDLSLRLDAALDAKLPAEGRIWAEKIESLRNSLIDSEEELRFLPLADTTRSVGEMCESSSGLAWGRRLFNAISASTPAICLELGTCLGISAAYQASALREIGSGRLITLEGSPDFAAVARRNLTDLGLDDV